VPSLEAAKVFLAEQWVRGLLAAISAAASLTAVVLAVVWRLRRRVAPSKDRGFPFDRIGTVEELEKLLLQDGKLTVTGNTFVARPQSEVAGTDSSKPHLLIVGPGGRGKTREAVEWVRRELARPGLRAEVCVPGVECGAVPYPPPIDKWPRLQSTVILFWDELDSAFPETWQIRQPGGEGQVALPGAEGRWRSLLRAFRTRCDRFIVIATAREENLGKLPGVDADHPGGVWDGFRVVRLPPFGRDQESSLVDGLAARFGAELDEDAREYLLDESAGAQAQSMVLFLRSRGGVGAKPITRDEAASFRKSASEYWMRETYDPLVKAHPNTAFVLQACRCLALDLDVRLHLAIVQEVAAELTPGRWLPYRRLKARRAMDLVKRRTLVGERNGCLQVADYQLEGVPQVDRPRILPALSRIGTRGPSGGVLFALAMAYLDMQEYAASEDCAKGAAALRAPGAHLLLGSVAAVSGHNELAEQAFDTAVERDPTEAAAWVGLGLSRAAMRRYPRAEEAFSQAVQLDAGYASAWTCLGLCRAPQGKHAEAEEAYVRAVHVDAEDAVAWLGLGMARGNQRKHVEAEEAYVRAVQLDPESASAWLGLGAAREYRGEHAEAEEAFARLVEIDPDSASAWRVLAATLEHHGKHSEAEEAYRRALELDDSHAQAWLWLGVARGAQDNDAGAEEAWSRAAGLGVDEAEIEEHRQIVRDALAGSDSAGSQPPPGPAMPPDPDQDS